MNKFIYMVHSGTNEEIEASETNFYDSITKLFEKLESLTQDDNLHLKSQGTRKPLRSTTALENCLNEDTVYLELLDKTKVVAWYNINKIDLEVTLG